MTAGRQVISKNKDWGTPQQYVDAVREVFGGTIHLDPCSSAFSVVHALTEYCLPEHDGLNESWDFPTVYVNPPYGNDRKRGTRIIDWLRKCDEAHDLHDAEVIALVPVATNTKHWKEYVFGRATAICFLYDTRLRFLVDGQDQGKGAPMSCAMIYWGNHYDRFFNVFIKYGAVVNITHLHRLSIGNASTSNGKRKTHGARVVQKPRSEPELVQVDLFVLDVQEVETARH